MLSYELPSSSESEYSRVALRLAGLGGFDDDDGFGDVLRDLDEPATRPESVEFFVEGFGRGALLPER
jgi:hypothetical protein